MAKLKIKNTEVTVIQVANEVFICITDMMAKDKINIISLMIIQFYLLHGMNGK